MNEKKWGIWLLTALVVGNMVGFHLQLIDDYREPLGFFRLFIYC